MTKLDVMLTFVLTILRTRQASKLVHPSIYPTSTHPSYQTLTNMWTLKMTGSQDWRIFANLYRGSLLGTTQKQIGSLPSTYLGLPMGTTKPRFEDLTPVMDRVERRLSACSPCCRIQDVLEMIKSASH